MSKDTILVPSKLTSTIKVSAEDVAAYDPPSSSTPEEPEESESDPELEPELEPEPESGVGLTAPPPPPPPHAANIRGKVIAENKPACFLSLLDGVNIFL